MADYMTISHYKAALMQVHTYCDQKAYSPPCIIAITKKQDVQTVKNVIAAGVRDIGENYIQEAQEKHAQGAYVGAKLHLVGRLQSNKAPLAAALFDVIHSLDKASTATKLDNACQTIDKHMDVFIQIAPKTSQSGRNGISMEEAPELIRHIKTLSHLSLIGLMAMPIHSDPAPEEFYKTVVSFGEKFGLTAFSMGMTNDWQRALDCGATHIRLGTFLFGKRRP